MCSSDLFRKKYGRTPSFYAAQAYDSAMLIKSAVEANHGDLTNHEQVRASLEQAKFDSVRGSFKLGKNHYPVQDFYLFEVVKGANNAGYALKLNERVYTAHVDPYVGDCAMAR